MDRRITNVPNSPFAVRQLVCALLPRQQFPPQGNEEKRGTQRWAKIGIECLRGGRNHPTHFRARCESGACGNKQFVSWRGRVAYVCDSFFSYTHRVAPNDADLTIDSDSSRRFRRWLTSRLWSDMCRGYTRVVHNESSRGIFYKRRSSKTFKENVEKLRCNRWFYFISAIFSPLLNIL